MEQRERWGSRTLFIFAAVGSAAGLGNLWRFPYLAYKYGGGAFLIPFFIILIAVGIPLLLLEFSIGQRFQKSAVESMYRVNRHFSGVGIMGVCNGFIITGYYAVVMAWAVIFLVNSFDVAWAGNETGFFYNTVLGLSSGIDNIQSIRWPIVGGLVAVWIAIYFSIWKGAKSAGKVILVTMPLPFILTIILAIKGSTMGDGSSVGLTAYLVPDFGRVFTDIEVWTAALSQIFFTLTLGFGTMITYGSFNDKNQELVKSSVWTGFLDCSISIIAGFAVFGTIGYMSYQLASESIANDEIPFQVAAQYSEIVRNDQFIEKTKLDEKSLATLPEQQFYSVNELSKAGITSDTLQLEKTYTAEQLKKLDLDVTSIDKNVLTRYHLDHSKLSGPGLAFVVYPKAIAMFKPRWTAIVFGVIFFITLLSLGIDSAFSLVEAITAAIADAVHRRQIVVNHSILALIVCIAGLAEGLIYATDGGLYILDIVDHYINNFGLVFVALMQAIAVGWFFDIEDHRKYINNTTNMKIGKWWNICIRYVAPAALLYLFGSQMYIDINSPYEGYPLWAQLIGWSVFFIPLTASLLIGSMIRLSREKGSL